eukprot:CAMPEP_0118632906 /NCGR_PEP_ID=MMETSP0785-20121206/703_1 /TAXON_ID=91992 /ORGANISM="Bolidomonas pacifica, Strain CCMP 1866" /LENGTH=555 /DNA_ID=CAMNT_0006523725 /DNA_START=492 /DNA_END=2156 /DNA_ORIENTATION=+
MVTRTAFDSGEFKFIDIFMEGLFHVDAASLDESTEGSIQNFANNAHMVDHSSHAEGASHHNRASYRTFELASERTDEKAIMKFSRSPSRAVDCVASAFGNPNHAVELIAAPSTSVIDSCRITRRTIEPPPEIMDENDSCATSHEVFLNSGDNDETTLPFLSEFITFIHAGILSFFFYTSFPYYWKGVGRKVNGVLRMRWASLLVLCLCVDCTAADVAGVASIIVSGMCNARVVFDGLYNPVALTASGKPYYKNENGKTLYFDPDCGTGSNLDLWIFDGQEPSVTAASDLDGDGTCNHAGFIADTGDFPPIGTNKWKVWCSGFVDRDITLIENECVATTSVSDDGSDGNIYCVNGGTAVGVVGACECVSCDAGFGGTNCAEPSCAAGFSETPPDNCSFQPTTRQELKDAINAHLSGSTEKGIMNEWDTSLITDMSQLFCGESWDSNCDCGDLCSAYQQFNEDIGGWDTSKVTDMSYMFLWAQAFNKDIGEWDTSKVTTMHSMFSTTYFNKDIREWDTSKVTDMSYMFYDAKAFNKDIGGWDTSKVTDMSYMFRGTE